MYVFSVVMSLCGYLSVCLCVFTWQKIVQAGGPETFFQLCLALYGLNGIHAGPLYVTYVCLVEVHCSTAWKYILYALHVK